MRPRIQGKLGDGLKKRIYKIYIEDSGTCHESKMNERYYLA